MNCGDLRKALEDRAKYPDDLPLSICVLTEDEDGNAEEVEELAENITARTDWDGNLVIAVITDITWEE